MRRQRLPEKDPPQTEQELTNYNHLALNKTRKCLASTAHFVVAIENKNLHGPNAGIFSSSRYPCPNVQHIPAKQYNFPAEANADFDMWRLVSAVCWPKSKQIFQEMVNTQKCLKQTR